MTKGDFVWVRGAGPYQVRAPRTLDGRHAVVERDNALTWHTLSSIKPLTHALVDEFVWKGKNDPWYSSFFPWLESLGYPVQEILARDPGTDWREEFLSTYTVDINTHDNTHVVKNATYEREDDRTTVWAVAVCACGHTQNYSVCRLLDIRERIDAIAGLPCSLCVDIQRDIYHIFVDGGRKHRYQQSIARLDTVYAHWRELLRTSTAMWHPPCDLDIYEAVAYRQVVEKWREYAREQPQTGSNHDQEA